MNIENKLYIVEYCIHMKPPEFNNRVWYGNVFVLGIHAEIFRGKGRDICN